MKNDKEFKGSKGEWYLPHFVGNEDGGCECGYLFSSSEDVVATIHFRRNDSIEESEYPEKAIAVANAKLVVAAPKLLEALQLFIDPLTGLMLDSVANIMGTEQSSQIEMAIEKALHYEI